MTFMSKENYNPEDHLLNTLDDLDFRFVKISNDGTILNPHLTFNKIFGYNPKKDLIGTKLLDYNYIKKREIHLNKLNFCVIRQWNLK